MRVIVDVPFKYAHWVVEVGQFGHVISMELLRSTKTYFKFYKRLGKRGYHLIAKDLEELTPDVVNVLNEVHVSEVILPPDAEFEFMKQAARLKIGVIGVPRGHNQEGFFKSLESMYMSRFVTAIGVCKDAMNVVWDAPDVKAQGEVKQLLSRLYVLRYMLTQDLTAKPVHILGLVNPEVELPLYREIGEHSPLDISVSTTYPFTKVDSSPSQLRRALDALLRLAEVYV